MSRFLSPRYQTLEAYTPGEQPRDRAYTKLNTNESPYPPSPEVLEVLTKADYEDLRLYSDPEAKDGCVASVSHYSGGAGVVFVDSVSGHILMLACMDFGEKGGL